MGSATSYSARTGNLERFPGSRAALGRCSCVPGREPAIILLVIDARAGLQAGLYPPPNVFAQQWALECRFTPTMAAGERERKLTLWRDAVRRTISQT